jgi:hypothetical protein
MDSELTTLIIGLGLLVLAGLTGAAAIRGALSANRNRTIVFGAGTAILALTGFYVTAGALFRVFLG